MLSLEVTVIKGRSLFSAFTVVVFVGVVVTSLSGQGRSEDNLGRHTAPYFHDNSAKTLGDVAAHYNRFFRFVTGGAIGLPPAIDLTPQDEADMVAFMKLLD